MQTPDKQAGGPPNQSGSQAVRQPVDRVVNNATRRGQPDGQALDGTWRASVWMGHPGKSVKMCGAAIR